MSDVQTGERYAKSPLTGNYYRVTRWVRLEGDKIQAKQKEEIERSEVPEKWLEVLDDE